MKKHRLGLGLGLGLGCRCRVYASKHNNPELSVMLITIPNEWYFASASSGDSEEVVVPL